MKLASNIRRHTWLLILICVAAIVASATAAATQQLDQQARSAIKNFGRVNQNYYRGSQPREEQLRELKKLGIKTIIDLRKDAEPAEAGWAKKLELQYFNIPLKASKGASREQAEYFLSLVNNPANWPVYVHCKGGRHRTGALTAIYRITHDGWTADQAFREMKEYDFDHGFFGGPGDQKRFVYDFYQRYLAHGSK